MRIDHRWPAERLIEVIGTPDCRVHFGQFGEDSFLADLFRHQPNGFYVDVGCHDPHRYSNTFLLWKVLGWHGINIDADSRAIERFRAARPNDTNLNIGIGPEDGEATLSLFDDGAVNTFDSATAEKQHKQFGEAKTVIVPVRTLRSVLAQYLPADTAIDYLNVDCEGLDESILRSNDWNKYRPRFVSVELHGLVLEQAAEHRVIQFMKDQGYRFHSMFWVTALFQRIR